MVHRQVNQGWRRQHSRKSAQAKIYWMLAKRSSVPAGCSSSSTDDKAQHNLHTWKASNSSRLEKQNGVKKRNWKRVLGREALVFSKTNESSEDVCRGQECLCKFSNEKGLKAPTPGLNTAWSACKRQLRFLFPLLPSAEFKEECNSWRQLKKKNKTPQSKH